MTALCDNRPARPSLALRIGVTGARRLRADQVPRIKTQLGSVLSSARQEMECLCQDRQVAELYVPAAEGGLYPQLRIFSPLARGADRIAAQIALEFGI